MKEYITKDRAKQFVCGHCNEVCSEEPCEPSDCAWMAFIDKEPAADVAPVQSEVNKEDIMARPTIREQMIECSEAMENGMITVARTRGIWQNDLIWYLCRAVKLLLDMQLKHK